MPPCCSRRWLLSNPPASSTCRKPGRRPHMEVSGLTGRKYIDNPLQNRLQWSWLSLILGVWMCVRVQLRVCVHVSPCSRPYLARVWPVTSSRVPEELLFPSGLVGPSCLLHTPTESLLDRSILLLITHTHTHIHIDRGRSRNNISAYFCVFCSSFYSLAVCDRWT